MREPMPDVVVLLPGITGSVLEHDGKVVWGFAGRAIAQGLFSRGKSTARSLLLESDDVALDDLGDGVRATKVIPDLHMLPGVWKIDGYTKCSDAIGRLFDVQPGRNYFEFPYDWRRDNRVAARKLAAASHKWLADWRAHSGNANARLILVAHSMGGLVSRYFLEVLGGWKDTRALITFGTPYRGSLNALNTLSNGEKKGPFGMIDFSELVRSFTALYQLLPIYPAYDGGDGKLARVGESSGIPNVDANRAAQALAFHREIEHAVTQNQKDAAYESGGYKIFPVVGLSQSTSQSARLANGGVDVVRAYQGRDMSGDGTVPRVSAVPLELSELPASTMYAATRHGELQNADAVLSHLLGVLTSFTLDLGAFRAPVRRRVGVDLVIDDLYLPGEPIVVRARPESREVGTLTATLEDAHSGQAIGSAKLAAHGDGWRETEFAAPAAGAYRVRVTGGDQVEPVADVCEVIGPELADG